MYSPRARSIAALRAAFTPWFFLPDQDETRVGAFDQGGRVVGGAVVHHDQLPIGEGLPLHARDRGPG